MKWIVPVCFIALLASACKNKPATQKLSIPVDSTEAATASTPSSDRENAGPGLSYSHPVLHQYDRYLKQLDTLDIESASKAEQEFHTLFNNQPAALCDTAFYLFKNFHSQLIAWGACSADTVINYDDLEKDKSALSEKQKNALQSLAKNGFKIEVSEGTPFIEEDWHFIATRFNQQVSPAMKQYLAQSDKEQKEGFQEDGGIQITPQQLTDRTVWWEQFNSTNPTFLYHDETSKWHYLLLSTLLRGMENTRAVEPGENTLSEYFVTAYNYLQQKYPQSKTYTSVKPYFTALLQKDTARANVLFDKIMGAYPLHY